MSLGIRTADPTDLGRVQALRRQAFVVEQELDYDELDDEIDDYSTILLGERDGELVATMRVTRRSEGPLEDEAPLGLSLWSREFADTELFQASRLVVSATRRGTTDAVRMIEAAYRHVDAAGGRVCFADARPERVSLYERLGMRRLGPPYQHPALDHEYVPLVMLIGDQPHFRQVRSLLARLTERDQAGRARAVYEGLWNHRPSCTPAIVSLRPVARGSVRSPGFGWTRPAFGSSVGGAFGLSSR